MTSIGSESSSNSFVNPRPRWLAEKGRLDEGNGFVRLCHPFPLTSVIVTKAARTLAKLHAHGNVNDPFVVSQMEDIKAEIQRAREIGSARYVFLNWSVVRAPFD